MSKVKVTWMNGESTLYNNTKLDKWDDFEYRLIKNDGSSSFHIPVVNVKEMERIHEGEEDE